MAISDIGLTAAMRNNLLQLQNTTKLMDRTQERLSTGKRVNEPIDDPTNFFAARNHMNRASDLSALKDAMGEAIQTVKAANHGIDGITSLIESMKGLVQSARGSDAEGRSALRAQFNEVRNQIDDLAADANYKGTNLLTGGSLNVSFNELTGTDAHVVGISGFSAVATSTTGLNITQATNTGGGAADWVTDSSYAGALDNALSELNSALNTLRTEAANLANNLTIVSVRQDFTDNMINTLKEGADTLTEADMNEEGANMLMLQTRQQLGVTSLSLASQNAQAVLRLF